MKVPVKQLQPGMVLLEDVLGKSGKPLMTHKTELTEQHILFLDKFMISDVNIVPFPGNSYDGQTFQMAKEESTFEKEYEDIVKCYQAYFTKMQQPIPLNNLFEIRKKFIPFFESVQRQYFTTLLRLFDRPRETDMISEKSVAMSMLAVFIARGIGYPKKDWLQIGFAALLADAGFARMSEEVRNETHSESPSEAYRMHPFYSYKIIEEVTTLTKLAKIAILQHHEQLDGLGYPAKISGDQMTPYARIIAVCDCFCHLRSDRLSQTIHWLQDKKGVILDKQVTGYLIQQLKSAQK